MKIVCHKKIFTDKHTIYNSVHLMNNFLEGIQFDENLKNFRRNKKKS